MNKQDLINGYKKMRSDINSTKDRLLFKIYSATKKYFKDTPKEQLSFGGFITNTKVDDIIFASLERTYAITIKAVKELYNIETNDKVEVADLMYSADGKTLYQRLQEHFDNACGHGDSAQYMFNRCVLIVDTETACVSNGIIHSKVNKHARYAEVLEGAECADLPASECEYWIKKGKMPIEELEELPPYHPDCDCEVIYFLD